jgi:non-ribosomal peptide synthase protein (TIGR01720 family)
MDELTRRIDALSPEKRKLLEMFLHEQDNAQAWRQEPYVAPRTPAEELLASIWSQVLGIERVGVNDNFFELGGDSIQGIQIVARAGQAGFRLSTNLLFAHPTVAELAALSGDRNIDPPEQGEVVGSAPLTPVQNWFFDQKLQEPDHWNQAVLLRVAPGVDPAAFEEVLRRLARHHDALRLRFKKSDGGWAQENAPVTDKVAFSTVDLSRLQGEEQLAALDRIAAETQAGLNLSQGSLFRALFFNLGERRNGRLLLVTHHLIADTVSLRLLVEDFQTAYGQLSRGEAISLPSKTASFRQWARRLEEYSNSAEVLKDSSYWLAEPSARTNLPVDFVGGVNDESSARTITVSLTEDETRAILQEIPAALRVQTNESLLTALVESLSEWLGGRCLRLDLEGHGREEILDGMDVSRTVGWFTSIFPVTLDLRGARTRTDALLAVKEQLRLVPHKGISYGLLRYSSSHASAVETLKSIPRPELVFNYLGQFDRAFAESALFSPARESCGPLYGPGNLRPYLLQVFGGVIGGRLEMNWTYSKNFHREGTISALAARFLDALRNLVLLARSSAPGRLIASDFPEAELTQEELNKLPPDSEDIYTLSPMQQGMLFEALANPGSAVYFEQGVCTLAGEIDVTAFGEAWRRVVARHPILRTGFMWEGLSKPAQVVHRQAELSFEQLDWRHAISEEHSARLDAYLRANAERGVNLAAAPLMRLTLIRLSDNRNVFVWAIHHLIHDAWSTHLLFREVFTIYKGLREGKDVTQGPGVPFRDYIVYVKRRDQAGAEEFWRQYLRGLTAPTRLPVSGRDITGREDDAHAREEARLPLTLTTALNQLARQRQLTLNSFFCGAWALLLSREAKGDDVVFGSVFSGRPPDLYGAERIVGPLINTLPMRVRVTPEKPFSDWLAEIQAAQIGLREYETTPLRQVQSWSEIPGGAPMFESVLVFQNAFADVSGQEIGELKIEDVRSFGYSNYPLTMRITPGREVLLEVLYDRRRFDPSTAKSLLEDLAGLLGDVAARQGAGSVGEFADWLAAATKDRRAGRRETRREAMSLRLGNVRPKTIRLSSAELVRTERLGTGAAFSILVRPAGRTLDLSEWAANNLERIEDWLSNYAAALFRGFAVNSIDDFSMFMRAISPELMEYRERSTPRTDLGNRIYTSTEYPADQDITFHNEFSYAYTWPMKIGFCCLLPPERGGETPVADSREVFRSLDPALKERFVEKGVMYVRNYGAGIDLSWQEAFLTADKSDVEEHCRNAPMEWEWNGDRLKTRQARPAVAWHPKTGDMVWLNQAHLFHVSNLDQAVRRSLAETFAEEDLPRNAYYGDGWPIEDSALDKIREAYRRASVSFAWQKGDVLLLDNMLAAHGRRPFTGQRRIITAMAEPFTLKP